MTNKSRGSGERMVAAQSPQETPTPSRWAPRCLVVSIAPAGAFLFSCHHSHGLRRGLGSARPCRGLVDHGLHRHEAGGVHFVLSRLLVQNQLTNRHKAGGVEIEEKWLWPRWRFYAEAAVFM